MFTFITIVLLSILGSTISDVTEDVTWNEYVSKYNIATSEEKKDVQKQTFLKNMEFITNFNKENNGFKLGVSDITHLTDEEYKSRLYDIKINKNVNGYDNIIYNSSEIPNEVDWRKHNRVTSVKNQGHCGSCWAFSTVGAVEGAYAKKTNKLVSLSAQQLVDCSTYNKGCHGGNPMIAFYYLEFNFIEKDTDYQYKAADSTCKYNKDLGVTKVSSFRPLIPFYENGLKKAIANIGPISVAIHASNDLFRHYKSGVHYDPSCSSLQLNHGVLAVGYGQTSDGKDYYIVKNSWGSDWGDNGYILMARGKGNNCGIATMASYPIIL